VWKPINPALDDYAFNAGWQQHRRRAATMSTPSAERSLPRHTSLGKGVDAMPEIFIVTPVADGETSVPDGLAINAPDREPLQRGLRKAGPTVIATNSTFNPRILAART